MDSTEQERLVGWIEAAVGETVTLDRAPVRREGWIVHGSTSRWFLRLGRDDDPANPRQGVIDEGNLTRLLGEHGLSVADVVAVSDDGAALYGWVDGTANVLDEPAERHDGLLGAYMDQLAVLHRLDPDELGVEWMPRPVDARQGALGHAEAVYDQMGAMALEPLSTFGMHWLRWNVPDEMTRVSVLHGDAGVGNFLVDAEGLTGVIDWEWAHLGDPMEDLGSVAMHAGFHAVGDLATAFRRYEAASGIAVDLDAVRFYAVHLYVRSVVALAAHVSHLDPHNPVALNLAYKLVNDRLTCEAIADATGRTLSKPELPDDDDPPLDLFGVVVANLDDDVVAATTSEIARDRAAMSARLVAMLGRRDRFGSTIDAIERGELATLLGRPVDDLDEGLRALDAAIPEWGPAREDEVLDHLYRRAVRAEWLSGPVAGLFPDRTIGRF